MSELKYQNWLCGKLKSLANLEHRRKPLSRHEQRHTRGIQKRIASLFEDPAISPADIERYKQIIKDYGFTIEQVTGKQPIFYGKITPQIRFLDEESIGVVWLGKFKLKASA
jgi:hypothetical protein